MIWLKIRKAKVLEENQEEVFFLNSELKIEKQYN